VRNGLPVVQPDRIDATAKSKIWDFTAATLRCDTPLIGTDVVNKDFVTGYLTTVAWGSITGLLVNQVDLANALLGKYSTTNPAGYISDLSGFTTTDLAEGTNLYYTDVRARAGVAGMGLSSFTNDLGFVSDLSSFTTDDLTQGTVNLYDKIVSLTAGTNVTITGTYPNFTIASTGGGGGAYLQLDQTTPETIINGVPLMTTPVDPYGSGDQLVNMDYVRSGMWLMPPIIEWYDPVAEGGLPPTPSVGDRYGADSTGYGWTIDYIYEWDGSTWVESTPEEGWMLWDLLGLLMYIFLGSGGWVELGAGSYLKLDQSTPEMVYDGAPIFDGGLESNDSIFINNSGVLQLLGGAGYVEVTNDGTNAYMIKSAGSNFSQLALGVNTVAGYSYIQSNQDGSGVELPITFWGDTLENLRINTNGTIKFPRYTAGFLKTDATGLIGLDTSTYLTTQNWQRNGTVLSPTTAGDTVVADGGLTIGNAGATSYTLKFDTSGTDGIFTYDGTNSGIQWDKKFRIGTENYGNFEKLAISGTPGSTGKISIFQLRVSGTETGGGTVISADIYTSLNTGVTNSNILNTNVFSALRSDASDLGTLGGMRVGYYQFGHSGAIDRVTNTVTGIELGGSFAGGTIGNLKWLYLRDGDTGGTVTNGYYIYQEDSTFSNYFEAATEFTNTLQLSNYTDNGFVKTINGDGTLDIDTSTYLTSITPAGLDTNVQYNDTGVLAGDANFTWDNTLNQLVLNAIATDAESGYWIKNTGATQPFTSFVSDTTAIGAISVNDPSGGSFGLNISGLSSGDTDALTFIGGIGSTTPTYSAFSFTGFKSDGFTGAVAFADNEVVLAVNNYTSGKGISVLGNGALQIGNIAGGDYYTLPAVDGTNGQVPQTDGSGTVSWATISGLISGLTTNAIPYATSATAIGSTTLTYDSVNEEYRIDATGFASAVARFVIGGTTTAKSSFYMAEASANTNYPVLGGIKTRGTIASPTATQSGDTLSAFTGGGYSGAVGVSGALGFQAAQTWAAGTPNKQGTSFFINLTPNDTASQTAAFGIEQNLGINMYGADFKSRYDGTFAITAYGTGAAGAGKTLQLRGGDGVTSGSGGDVDIISGNYATTGNAGNVHIYCGGTASNWVTRYSQQYFGGYFGEEFKGSGGRRQYYNDDAMAKNGFIYDFRRSRGTWDSPTAVNTGDILGQINFSGLTSGANYEVGAYIRAMVETAVSGGGDIGTSLSFWTSPDGSSTPLERMTISNAGVVTVAGNVGIGTSNPLYRLHEETTGAANYFLMRADTTGNFVIGQRTDGTIASPTALAQGRTLFSLEGGGYNGTTWVTSGAYWRIRAKVDGGTWGVGDNPTEMIWAITANGHTDPDYEEMLRLDENGLWFGTGINTFDVRLYRSAANVLKTDDNLAVVGYFDNPIPSFLLEDYNNAGIWRGEPTELGDIAAKETTPAGSVSAWDVAISGYKTVLWTGSAWAGDTTFSVTNGTLLVFQNVAYQIIDLAWVPLGTAFPLDYLVNNLTVSSGGIIRGEGLDLPHIINKIASANIRNSHDAEATSQSTSYVKVKTITLTNGLLGQQRFVFDLKTSNVLNTANAQIYRNGVALGTEQSDVTGVYVTKSEDITQDWNPGDTVELWVKIDNAAQIVYVRNFRISYDDSPTITVASSNS
jgi:hypothetical protein